MAKAYALVVGVVLLIAAVIGFLKTEFLGLQFTALHNWIHLVTGLIGLWAGMGKNANAPRIFAQIFGVIYTLVALAGFVHVPAALTEMLLLNTSYNVIHLAVGVSGMLVGATAPKAAAAA